MINHSLYHPSRPQNDATINFFYPSLPTAPPNHLDCMFHTYQEYKCWNTIKLSMPCVLFPRTSMHISSNCSISNGWPPLAYPNLSSMVSSTSMDLSLSMAPCSVVPPPPSTTQPLFFPPLVPSKGKEPMVVDPPSSSQQIYNKIKHN